MAFSISAPVVGETGVGPRCPVEMQSLFALIHMSSVIRYVF